MEVVEMRKLVLGTLIVSLSAPLAAPANAFSFGDILGGAGSFLGGLDETTLTALGLSKDFVEKFDVYSKVGQIVLGAVKTKSVSSLFSALPGILKGFGNGTLEECSDPDVDCGGLLGDAGTADWENIYKKIEDSVNETTSASDDVTDDAIASGGGIGPINSGLTDKRYRPRITTQQEHTKIATWTKVQDAQFQAMTGKDGQKLIKDQQTAVEKVVEESFKVTGDIAKLDNTQDILKKREVNSSLGLQLQGEQISEAQALRLATYDGNQTANEQLSLQQKEQWEKEVQTSQAHASASAEGDAFSDFITSGYTDPTPISP
jgi:hypothetical protein